jgi:methyl-accepting chemotaxis protein
MILTSSDNALNVVNRSTRKLKDCIQALEVLSASTEDQFLDIGNRLSAFYNGAAKVSQQSGTIVGLFSGADITGTIEGLNSLMDGFVVNLKHFDSITVESLSKLNSISDRMEDVEWQLEDMNRITRVLSGLGFNIRVQNAILKRPVAGMTVLGEEVKKLSSDIVERSSHIVRDTNALTGIVQNSRQKVAGLSSLQQTKATKIINSTMSNIGSLKEKYGRSAGSADQISSCSDEISQCIREIVTFIQFHDITRQQFESSLTAFNKMAAMLENISEEDDLSRTVGKLARFCVQEGATLHKTRSDFFAVVTTVIENLEVLSKSVKKLLEEVNLLVSSGSSAEGSFLATIEDSLSSVTLTISAFLESGMVKGELSGATTVVADTIAEMSGFIQEIENIGEEIDLMALNASVKADQIGEEGRALGVVSDEIQRISAQAQVHTSSITGILKTVGSYAEELLLGVDAGESDYTRRISEMSETLDVFVDSLRDLNSKLISTIQDIDGTGRGLFNEIDEIIGNICIHNDVDFVIGEVLSNLRDVVSDVSTSCSEMEELSDVLLPLSPHSYDQMLEAEVKLSKTDKNVRLPGSTSEGMGDNVELF